MTDNQAAKITANKTAIKPLQRIMLEASAGTVAVEKAVVLETIMTLATQGIVDIYKELNELAERTSKGAG